MLPFARQKEHPWIYALGPEVPFKWHGPARYHDWEAAEREREPARRKARGTLTKVRGKVQTLLLGARGITTYLAKPTPFVGTHSPNTSATTDLLQLQSSFFGKLPVELRKKVYDYVVADYSDTVHILAGDENGYSSRTLFHTPCITPADLEVPPWWIFQNSRWNLGPWGSYHLYCDLNTSRLSFLHKRVANRDMGCLPLGESRTVCEIVCEAKERLQGKAPFLPLFLTCRQMYEEAIRVVYSSLTMSFIGDRPLSLFTRNLDSSLIRSLLLIHLVWPSWWKGHLWSRMTGGTTRRWELWYPPEPEPSVAKAEWEELWCSFSRIGPVKRLHVTIFQSCGATRMSDGSIDLYHAFIEGDQMNIIPIDELLPALNSVRADEFFVEAYAETESVEEPSTERPFRLHYNPALGTL